MTIIERFKNIPESTVKNFRQLCWLAVTTFSITVIMTPLVWEFIQPMSIQQGEVARHTVHSSRDFSFEDRAGTERRKNEVESEVKAFFFHEDTEENFVATKFHKLTETIQKVAEKDTEDGRYKLSYEQRNKLNENFQLALEEEEWSLLLDPNEWPHLRDALAAMVDPVLNQGVTSTKGKLRSALRQNRSGAILTSRSTGEKTELTSISDILDLKEAKRKVLGNFPISGFNRGVEFDSLVRKLSIVLVSANVFFDSEETEKQKALAKAGVKPLMHTVRSGEEIVHFGEAISPLQAEKLKELQQLQGGGNIARAIIGYVILSIFVIISVYYLTIEIVRGFRPSNRDLTLMVCTLVGSFLLVKATDLVAAAATFVFPSIDSSVWLLLTPVAAGGILLNVTLGASSLLLYVLIFGLLSSIFLPNSWVFLLLIVVGNVVGAFYVRHCARRSVFLIAGMRVAIVNMFIVLCFVLLQSNASVGDNILRVVCAALGGFASGLLASALTPIAELIGGYITEIKLLELASLDQPLLRDLSVQAPGTWNHSVVIGQMCEAAAEAIGVSPLLVRVGAYYHDIGKTKKPTYFTENQAGKKNPHDKLAPSMSALIIKAHVKDGIEMARYEKLPEAIIDFIPQHHGTTRIEFFYEKALKEAEDGEVVEETNYRYPGPKPQTKAAGLLMLADGIEASSRTLSDPSPAKIQGLVQKQINKVFAIGELDESELTLKDLHLIAKCFTRVLSGIYHRRVEYPEPAEKIKEKREEKSSEDGDRLAEDNKQIMSTGEEKQAVTKPKRSKKKNGDRDTIETKSGESSKEETSDKQNQKNSPDALKRLGM